MHPAASIIFFTTASGLGYGLAAILGLGLLDPTAGATKAAHFTALALIAAGLMSSTLHLGNPQRAWRALSQWRSSWLSREGVLAIATFIPLTINAAASLFLDRYVALAGIAGTVLAAATVYSTAMIYASLRAIQGWNTGLTPVCYLLFSLSGGLVAATFFAALGAGEPRLLALAAIATLVAAWLAKARWWTRLDTHGPLSTPESATGLGPIGTVRLFESPHMTDNYLTREMGYRVARKHAAKLRRIAVTTGGAVPALLMAAVAAGLGAQSLLALVALVSCGVGLVTERWLFFAEARHAMTNYYGGAPA